MPAKPLSFGNLSLTDRDFHDGGDLMSSPQYSEARLQEMLAAQEAHTARFGAGFGDEETVATDTTMDDARKRDMLQKALHMAASNGEVDRVERILGGKARAFVDIDAPDDDGTPPLIYASCFVSGPYTQRTCNSLWQVK